MTAQRLWAAARAAPDIAREVQWRLAGEEPAPAAISFPLPPERLEAARIRWPERYEWPVASRFVEGLRAGMARFVPVKRAAIAEPYRGVVVIQIQVRGRTHSVAIDYSDHLDQVNAECLRRSAVYFKMQFRKEGYADLGRDSGKMLPGGYINGDPGILRYLPGLRRSARARGPRYEAYGRFGTQAGGAIRNIAMNLLRDQSAFRYEGGLQLVRYSRSVWDAGRSRICIDLPGNGDFCYRLVDYFAVGACVIGPPHRVRLHVPLEDRKHLVHSRPDLSDLVALCSYYLAHEDERQALCRNSREYFDRYLHPHQLAAYYLHQCVQRVW